MKTKKDELIDFLQWFFNNESKIDGDPDTEDFVNMYLKSINSEASSKTPSVSKNEKINVSSITDESKALHIADAMGSATRMPESFLEFDGEEIMSNFDGAIVQETTEAIKGKELFSRYAGWNFNGKVWWQNGKWCCEVWCYGSFQKTFVEETLQDIMSEVCSEYGSD